MEETCMFQEEACLFQKARVLYDVTLPPALRNGADVRVVENERTSAIADEEIIQELFGTIYGSPVLTFEATDKKTASRTVNVGVIFSGGQAPGGHNVISGLFDGIRTLNKENRLFGFLDGPEGLIKNRYRELTHDIIAPYRNTGGFDMIGSSRTKLEKPEQFEEVRKNCLELGISALVIIGGDDSNTNTCMLAEYFNRNNVPVQLIGCPKTIDGDLKNKWIECSFGFDTASKVYRGLISNICRDAISAKKYWHFIKLMGRSASHITLECALQTHPNITLISEEIMARNHSLRRIVNDVAESVAERSESGMDFGVVLVPEGLIEFIPEIGVLIEELNELFAARGKRIDAMDDIDKQSYLLKFLSETSAAVFQSLPRGIQTQLCAERDPHGNAQVSLVETEKLIAEMVEMRLMNMMRLGQYKGSFQPAFHFFGYEGRCAAPTNFDACYSYGLGYSAAALINAGKTGYMSCVRNTTKPISEWVPGGIPLTAMMNMERRSGKDKPVIKKSLVDLEGKPFRYFAEHRGDWKKMNSYVYHSNIQYFGPSEICDEINITTRMEQDPEDF